MSTPEPTPQFGAMYLNTSAGDKNPHRIGRFVKAFRRTGKLNPGPTWEMTDGKGDFWEIDPKWLVPATPEPELNVGAELERLSVKPGVLAIHKFMDTNTGKEAPLAYITKDGVAKLAALIQQVSDQRVREFSDSIREKLNQAGLANGGSVHNMDAWYIGAGMSHVKIIDQTLKEYLDHD